MLVLDTQQYEYMLRYSRQAGFLVQAGSQASLPVYMQDYGYSIDSGADVSLAITVTNVSHIYAIIFYPVLDIFSQQNSMREAAKTEVETMV